MVRIELVGPSGVGKTTLYNKLDKIPEEDRFYLTLRGAFKRAALNEQVPLTKFNLWLYQLLLKTGLFDHKARGLGKKILYDLQNRSTRELKTIYDPFLVSHYILLDYLKDQKHSFTIYKRLRDYHESIERYLILKDALPVEHRVLFDEGMLHYNPALIEKYIGNYTLEALKKDAAFQAAGIISCEQTAEVIYDQALKRKKKGIYTYTQGPMTDKELKSHAEDSVINHRQKINFYKRLGTPVLSIDPREPLGVNAKKINEFVFSLASCS